AKRVVSSGRKHVIFDQEVSVKLFEDDETRCKMSRSPFQDTSQDEEVSEQTKNKATANIYEQCPDEKSLFCQVQGKCKLTKCNLSQEEVISVLEKMVKDGKLKSWQCADDDVRVKGTAIQVYHAECALLQLMKTNRTINDSKLDKIHTSASAQQVVTTPKKDDNTHLNASSKRKYPGIAVSFSESVVVGENNTAPHDSFGDIQQLTAVLPNDRSNKNELDHLDEGESGEQVDDQSCICDHENSLCSNTAAKKHLKNSALSNQPDEDPQKGKSSDIKQPNQADNILKDNRDDKHEDVADKLDNMNGSPQAEDGPSQKDIKSPPSVIGDSTKNNITMGYKDDSNKMPSYSKSNTSKAYEEDSNSNTIAGSDSNDFHAGENSTEVETNAKNVDSTQAPSSHSQGNHINTNHPIDKSRATAGSVLSHSKSSTSQGYVEGNNPNIIAESGSQSSDSTGSTKAQSSYTREDNINTNLHSRENITVTGPNAKKAGSIQGTSSRTQKNQINENLQTGKTYATATAMSKTTEGLAPSNEKFPKESVENNSIDTTAASDNSSPNCPERETDTKTGNSIKKREATKLGGPNRSPGTPLTGNTDDKESSSTGDVESKPKVSNHTGLNKMEHKQDEDKTKSVDAEKFSETNFNEQSERAKQIIHRSKVTVVKQKAVLYFMSEDETELRKTLTEYCDAIGINPPVVQTDQSSGAVTGEKEHSTNSSNPSGANEANKSVREATVGADVLGFVYHVHLDKLKADEKKYNVEFVWNGGESFIYNTCE
uniref:Dentin sialophosphoprotein-like n=1 Tax=Saccoglossus kowalevskii TaxID=10224 RepID=A0ABM0M692_SACKO